MTDACIARLMTQGEDQILLLPAAFRLTGDRVRLRRVEGGILIEPIITDLDRWFAELDRFADIPFLEDECPQPKI
jgi:antitoxin VapB